MNYENEYSALADLLALIVHQTGPVLVTHETVEQGLPEEVQGVMVEQTQEGFLIFLVDKTSEELNESTE